MWSLLTLPSFVLEPTHFCDVASSTGSSTGVHVAVAVVASIAAVVVLALWRQVDPSLLFLLISASVSALGTVLPSVTAGVNTWGG